MKEGGGIDIGDVVSCIFSTWTDEITKMVL